MRIALLGLGQVGRALLRILSEKKELYSTKGKQIQVVLAADFHHVIYSNDGMDPSRLLYYKEKGDIWGSGYAEIEREALLEQDFDVLVDMMPATSDGIRARDLYKTAFSKGRSVVTACKSGLANHWEEIMHSSKENDADILYEATVAGGVPFFSFIKHCIMASEVTGVVGQVNSAANFVIQCMSEGGTFGSAIEKAKVLGILETDYHFDTLGLDSAWKTVIVANSVFGANLSVKDIQFDGVEDLSNSSEKLTQMRLLADVKLDQGKITATSVLRELDRGDPLSMLKGQGLGYTVHMADRAPLTVLEFKDGPNETAYAVANDILLSSSRNQ